MVSGWDKYPGPDNDYASAQSPWKTVVVIVVVALSVLAVGLAFHWCWS